MPQPPLRLDPSIPSARLTGLERLQRSLPLLGLCLIIVLLSACTVSAIVPRIQSHPTRRGTPVPTATVAATAPPPTPAPTTPPAPTATPTPRPTPAATPVPAASHGEECIWYEKTPGVHVQRCVPVP